MNEVLISFFESRQSALSGLALMEPPTGNNRGRRTGAVVVSREADGSRSPFDPPRSAPFGAVVGLVLGSIVGSFGGEAGLVVGLFFGFYAGLFVDIWRTLARCDLLDEIQNGLAHGQAALVSFVGDSSAASIERRLAGTDAVTVHRFPRTPIEEDVAREVREATTELRRLVPSNDAGVSGSVDRERRIDAARRKLSMLEAMTDRLLWLERLQFEFETDILSGEIEESPRWRAARIRHSARKVRASHRRFITLLEASRDRVREAARTAAAMASDL